MMRVIGGRLKGRTFKAPPTEPGVRPAIARVRQAVFDVLGPVDGCRVLDLFGGSGSLTIEAFSRGAAEATIVEKDRKNAALIRENLASFNLGGQVITSTVQKALPRLVGQSFDLIFIDPPFEAGLAEPAAEQVLKLGLAGEGAVIVVRFSCREKFSPPNDFEGQVDFKRYGDSQVAFLYNN